MDSGTQGVKRMTIDLKHSFILQKQIKNTINKICKSIISEIDKDQELNICKRSFEIEYKNGKKYQVSLEIKEVKE